MEKLPITGVVPLGNVSGVTELDAGRGNFFTCTLTGVTNFRVKNLPPGSDLLVLATQSGTGFTTLWTAAGGQAVAGAASDLTPSPTGSTLFRLSGSTQDMSGVRMNPNYAAGATSSYVLDFVRDCGADPTGATECTPALNTAGALLAALATDPKLPRTPLRLYVPRGRYLVTGAPNPWVFTNAPQCIEVVGTQDASIFECGMVTHNDFGVFQISQCMEFRLEGLTFVGTTDTFSPADTGAVLVSTANLTTIERCRFMWIVAALGLVQVSAGALRMYECTFIRSGCSDPTKASIYIPVQNGLDVLLCRFLDDGPTLNGYVFPDAKVGAAPWIRIDDSVATGAGDRALVRIVATELDEQATPYGIIIRGGATGRVPHVELRGTKTNTVIGAVSTAALATIHIEKTDLLVIDGHIDTGFNTVKDVPTLELVDVTSSHIRGFIVNPGAVSRYLTADAACGFLEIQDGNIAEIDLRSSAGLTTRRVLGRTEDLFVANGNIVAHQLCKNITGGVIAITVADTIDAVSGAASAAAAATNHVALSRPSTPTTMLSDGSAPIAIGDNVGISGTSAGRVKTVAASAVDRVGKALSAAAAAADAQVSVMFVPFKS